MVVGGVGDVRRVGAVDSRGSTTPPALNIVKYLIIRALTYALTVFAGLRPASSRVILGLRPVSDIAVLWCKDKGWMGWFALRFEGCFQSWCWDVGDLAVGVGVISQKINAEAKKEIYKVAKACCRESRGSTTPPLPRTYVRGFPRLQASGLLGRGARVVSFGGIAFRRGGGSSLLRRVRGAVRGFRLQRCDLRA